MIRFSLMLALASIFTNLAQADIPFAGDDELLTIEICEEVTDANSFDRTECEADIIKQRVRLVQQFAESMLIEMYPTDYWGCAEGDKDRRKRLFREREDAFSEYLWARVRMKFTANEKRSYPRWVREQENIHADALLREVNEGIAAHYCESFSQDDQKILLVGNFAIEIEDDCEKGLFLCEAMTYTGVNRNTQESIQLSGTYLLGDNAKQVGFKFENGNIHYEVYFDGSLRIQNSNNNTELYNEQGRWVRECDDCFESIIQ